MLRINFLRAIAAGAMIAIAGTAYLTALNPILGMFLFCVGLLSIVFLQLDLFTGKAGYLGQTVTPLQLLVIFIGNFIGVYLITSLIMMTTIGTKLMSTALPIATVHLATPILSMLILGFFCGILMYVAVEAVSYLQYSTAGVIMVVLPVITFISCGFYHSIADIFFYSICGFSLPTIIVPILIIAIGNLIGSQAISLIVRYARQKTCN